MKLSHLLGTLALLSLQPLAAVEIRSVSEDYPPYEYIQSGQPIGFTVELVREMLERSGHSSSGVEILPWARAYKIAQNEPNVRVHRMTRSESREPLFKWIGKISDKKPMARLIDYGYSNLANNPF